MNTEPDARIQSLERRIDELQREISMRRSRDRRLLLAICFCAVPLMLVAAQRAPEGKVLSAERFELRDRNGVLRGFFGVQNGMVTLMMNGKDSMPSLMLGTSSLEDARLDLGGVRANSVSLGTSKSSAALYMGTPDGYRISLNQHTDGDSALIFSTDQGEPMPRFAVASTAEGQGQLTLKNKVTDIGLRASPKGDAFFTLSAGEWHAEAGVLDPSGFGLKTSSREGERPIIRLPTPAGKRE